MKVYIASDLEGISGVVHPEHTGWDGRRHQEARKWLTEHLNAAIGAAVAAGAAEVVVCDGHSNGRNVVLDLLHPEAKLMWGRQGRWLGQVHGIDQGFDALLMVGFHARAGTLGVLNHTTNSGVIHEVRFNGLPMGEIDFNAALAGHFGVPVAMVSGDATAVAQAKERYPQIETAAVMESVGQYSAKVLAPAKAQALIREATAKALARLSQMKPYVMAGPIRMETDFKDSAMADAAAMTPGVERSGPRSCACTCKDAVEAYRYHSVMVTLAASERWERTA